MLQLTTAALFEPLRQWSPSRGEFAVVKLAPATANALGLKRTSPITDMTTSVSRPVRSRGRCPLPLARGRGHRPRLRTGLLTLVVMSVIGLVLFSPSALAVAGASFTTANSPLDGDHCLNGSNNAAVVNCNIYDGKQYVWINGGPNQAGPSSLTDGVYFFAVLVPGGQPDPNDDGAKNLSDQNPLGGFDDTCGDPYTNREFTVSGGDISSSGYSGDGGDYYTDSSNCALDAAPDPHDQSGSSTHGQLIRLFPYDTTNNPGGVYILAVCYL